MTEDVAASRGIPANQPQAGKASVENTASSTVIARSPCDEAIQTAAAERLDCFAALV